MDTPTIDEILKTKEKMKELCARIDDCCEGCEQCPLDFDDKVKVDLMVPVYRQIEALYGR
jgi:hypothetical protein